MGNATKKGLRVADGVLLPLDYVTKTCAILAQRRKGKRLALDTPLPTPTGWTTMGDVEVGDDLFDELGEPCRVTYVAEVAWGDSYRVRFSDGAEIVADAEHLWVTESLSVRRRESAIRTGVLSGAGREGRPQSQQTSATMPQVRTTAEIAAALRNGRETNHSIRVALPLDLPEAALSIDPYVLGFWLGDGTRGYGAVTLHDSDAGVLAEIGHAGYAVRERPSQRNGGTASYTILGLQPQLRALGVLREKHIPLVYLRSSEEQRLALLQGIADADGSCSEQGQVEISASDPRLARDIYELVVSLGIKATQAWRETAAKPSCRIRFTTSTPAFRLARKRRRQPQARTPQIGRRFIVSIERTASVPMRCIAVDSSSRLFLAGESMIPTHNTYLASDLAEELVAAEMPWVALDPTGAWWGLRSSADGKHVGLPVVVIGGQHGDLPLEREGGAVIADLVLDHPGWYVLDLSLLESRAAEREFTATFGARLHRRKMQPGMDFPLHLFVDEADLFVSQEKETTWNSGRGSRVPDVLAVYGGIVRRGGLHGLGSTLISQRPALINKNALTQIDLLFLLRLVAGQDQDAVYKNNVSRFLPKKEALALMATLATMPIGEGWILEPGADPPTVERVRFRERRTFNSSATPKPGERRVEPSVFAEIDLDEIRAGMESAIEGAQQDDPVALRQRVRAAEDRAQGLEQQVEQWKERSETAAANAEPEVVEVPVYTVGDLDEVWKLVQATKETGDELVERLHAAAQPLAAAILAAAEAADRPAQTRPAPTPPPPSPAPPPVQAESTNGTVKLKAGERRMLVALARLHPEPLTRSEVATLSDVSPRGGTFTSYLSTLRQADLIREDGQTIALTHGGLSIAGGDVGQGAPSTSELLAMWSAKLKLGARRMLQELVAVYPDGLTRADLADRAEVSPAGGTFTSYLSSLRRNGLLDESGGLLRAGHALFLGAPR